MGSTVLPEFTNVKGLNKGSRDLSFSMVGKEERHWDDVSDQQYSVGAMDKSEGLGSSCQVDSDDYPGPKRKCISLNANEHNGFNVPLQVLSVSKMSSSERRVLVMRLTDELMQVQVLQKRIMSRSSRGDNGDVKRRPLGWNSSYSKSGTAGRFVPTGQAPHPLPVGQCNGRLMKQCETLLKRLMSHKRAWIFNSPVDPVKLQVPDYFDIIKNPMDLGTIKTKLTSGTYSSPWNFLADVRLTFTNAKTYNPPGNKVYETADIMSKFFERGWKLIEKKLEPADLSAKSEIDYGIPEVQPRKRKSPPASHNSIVPESVKLKPKMTIEEKLSLTRHLESLGDLPQHIIDFLRVHNVNGTSEHEIEIDIDSISDDRLFELRDLLDSFIRDRQSGHPVIAHPCEMEIINESGPSNSSMHPSKGHEFADEDVDIVGDDPPVSSCPPMEIERDAVIRSTGHCSPSSSSTSSGSSSSDSDSSGSAEGELDKQVSAPKTAANEKGWSKGDIVSPLDANSSAPLADLRQQDACSEPRSTISECHRDGENAPTEQQVFPEKIYRAALLRGRFAETILKAREKTLVKGEKMDPEELQREREELEKQQREEKARLLAEAKSAEEARKRAEAEAVAQARRKRELEREAARQALLQMEKSVEINENSFFLRDLEMLGNAPGDHAPSSVDEMSPDGLQEGIADLKLGGGNPLEQLGLYMKAEDEEEEEEEIIPVPLDKVEEGELD